MNQSDQGQSNRNIKKVFISYSTKDKEVAAKVRAVLEEHGIAVTIDSESMPVGGDIRAFIDKSIHNTNVTLSIVSQNSLASDWVALESVESFMAVKQVEGKKFIACFIDEEFLRPEFQVETAQSIKQEISKLDELITRNLEMNLSLDAFQSTRNRLLDHQYNLPKIINYLNSHLTHDIREPVFDVNIRKIINDIRPGAGSGSRRELELRYLDWFRTENIKNELKYTKLSGQTQQKKAEIRNIFWLKPGEDTGIAEMFAKDGRKQQLEQFEDAVTEILKLRRAVLLGDPGSGKSTTLWKLAEKLCADLDSDPKAPLPVLVRLGLWTAAEETLTAFITRKSGPLPAPIDQLLSEKRAAILLDGMNEIPTGQWTGKFNEIRNLIRAHPDLITVVSCRELDYKVDLRLNRIAILPLDPLRIRHFTNEYLEMERGNSLFWKLAGKDAERIFREFIRDIGPRLENPEQTFWLSRRLPADTWFRDWDYWTASRDNPGSLMVLSRNPFMLKMICEIYDKVDTLPENKGMLFGRFVEKLIEREFNRETGPEENLSPEEKELLQDALQAETSLLKEKLSLLAYEMQTNPSPTLSADATVEDPDDDEIDDDDDTEDGEAGDEGIDSTEYSTSEGDKALTSLPVKRVDELIGDRLLKMSLSANLLSGDEEIRFAHQLLQEYFTAIYMEEEINSGRLKATEIWPAESWWERTNWEVATRLLAGLHTNDCSKVVKWVAEANPEVAAECIELSGAKLAIPTKKQLRKEWRTRLLDTARDSDPRARAAVGRALGLTGWDNRDGVGTVEIEIDGQKIHLPDFDKAWVDIPAGEFTSGPLRGFEYDKGEFIDYPQRKVTLPAFRISRYPVTFAQFQTFVDDPEGYQNQDRWFEGLAADEDDRRLRDQYFRVEGRAYPNTPREMVNWYQAIAFCRWLSWRLGGGYDLKKINRWVVRLPTEYEWEKAARGTDGRIYPYPGDFDPENGNTWETGIGMTSAVGIFPRGNSPYGVMDMSGNVWEWCLNKYEKPHEPLARIKLDGTSYRPLRGGSWVDPRGAARAVYRFGPHPDLRYYGYGFRVMSVVRPPS